MSNKRLYKSTVNCMLCGVCGGIAEYFDIDPTLVRLAWVILTCFGGAGIWAYIIAAIIIFIIFIIIIIIIIIFIIITIIIIICTCFPSRQQNCLFIDNHSPI